MNHRPVGEVDLIRVVPADANVLYCRLLYSRVLEIEAWGKCPRPVDGQVSVRTAGWRQVARRVSSAAWANTPAAKGGADPTVFVAAYHSWWANGIASRLTAVGAPAAGLGLYLAWTWVTYGDALAPFRAQTAAELRGGVLVSPLRTLATVLNLLSHGQVRSVVLHLVWVMVALALLVVSARRLPASFTVFAAATLFLAITVTNFGSFERYASSALPLLFAAAIVLTEHPRVRRFATIAAPLLLFGHSLLAFIGGYVP